MTAYRNTRNIRGHCVAPSSASSQSERMRSIAYSMDTLVPGFYLWLGPIKVRLGGTEAEDNYPGTIHSSAGMAVVLPGYRIYSTYQGEYDPR